MYDKQLSQLTDTNGRILDHFVTESYCSYRKNPTNRGPQDQDVDK